MNFLRAAACLLAIVASSLAAPQQIHLSLTGSDSTQMIVMWATWAETTTSTVYYWPVGSTTNITVGAIAPAFQYTYAPNYTSPFFHVVLLTNLTNGVMYNYICGDASDGFSQTFQFFAGYYTNGPLRIAQVADLGTTQNSVNNVNGIVAQGNIYPYSFLIFSGDLSYANGFQPIWDTYQALVQPSAATLPWMYAVGNHESYDLYESYLYRFVMPVSQPVGPRNLHYSFNYGNLVHVISLNSELDDGYGYDFQYYWLQNDLQTVNRTATPWIIGIWHTPWYCTNTAHYLQGEPMRKSYEQLFYQYGVDVVINGHVHAYQRTAPMYNGTVTPNGTIYITSGVGGNDEGLYDSWHTPDPVWSVAKAAVFGFGSIEIYNATHMHWDMKRANDSVVFDDTWIVRTRANTTSNDVAPATTASAAVPTTASASTTGRVVPSSTTGANAAFAPQVPKFMTAAFVVVLAIFAFAL